jgi:acyl-[acyl-carrier-protein]-phospholipid O-acyltransferase/long-chain-fatty-acid--[acyl-carrier-protein] ligase
MDTEGKSLGGFWALVATQFQGAFSDNALKWLISFLVIDAGLSAARRDLYFVLVVPLLFAIPWLLFSIPGGFFADRFSKRTVTIWTKLFELGVMGLVTLALTLNRLDIAGAALFLACTQGAIFGPTKYGLLPELLPVWRLSWGNGIIELTTLVAAILGTLAGGFLAHDFRGEEFWSGIVFMGLSVAGMLTAVRISRVPAADATRNFTWNWAADFLREVRRIGKDARLAMAVVANTYFWFLGAVLLINIVLYATDILRVDEAHSSYLLAGLSLGIGVGSFLAGYASGKKIEIGMVLPSLGGLVICCALLSLPRLSYGEVMAGLGLLGAAGGFFVVPVNAVIQNRPQPEEKGRVIAAANLLSWVGIALQPVAQYAMIRLGHPNPSRVFLLTGGATLVMGVALWLQLPELWKSALSWTRLQRGASL